MAFRYIAYLLKTFLLYLFLFALCRFIFLLYFSGEIINEGIGIFFQSLLRAFPLDISTACYLLFVPALLFLLQVVSQSRIFLRLLKIYLSVTSVIYIVLAICEIGVYREVHVKPYFNLLLHLQRPDELILSVSPGMLCFVLFLIALLCFLYVKLLNRLFRERKEEPQKINWRAAALTFILFLLTVPVLVLGCRGGWQPMAINEGEVYFSHNQCVNDATVNPLWNIVHSYIETRNVLYGNAYQMMSDGEAEKIVHELFSIEKDSTLFIFKYPKPNVCILILESWSADMIASCGGYEGLTPDFEKLISDGYLFTQAKPAGHLSDQGIPAVLSGYPALPIGSAINQPAKQVKLPCLNNEFQQAGYNSSFFFGGQLIYGGIKTYIYRNKFGSVIEQQTLPSSLPAGRLGIHDSLMLSIWRDSINRMNRPFFSCLFTLSTHSPFDATNNRSITWGDMDNASLNCIVYSDRQIGKFFEEAKKKSWYDSTVFILVADHSHHTPKNYEYCVPETYHIPLLICGGALKDEFRGVKNNKIVSQTDIASTLLHQLHLPDTNYPWSKNLLNPYTKEFAFYTFDEGFGFVEGNKRVLWNKKFPTYNRNDGNTVAEKDLLDKKGKAMLQVLMKDFLSK